MGILFYIALFLVVIGVPALAIWLNRKKEVSENEEIFI